MVGLFMAVKNRSSLIIIFTTVLVDLIGFGIVIPLVGLYGKHYGASGFLLSILGAIFSICQFFFTPFWGSLSDRIGRRPVILISLAGSTISYVVFALAPSFTWLLISRALAGVFAANISAAQAYIADITTKEERAKGMGLIGAAFGIGFTLGPPLGGIASAQWGLAAPGLIAAGICGVNFLLAIWRLPESLKPEFRARSIKKSLAPLSLKAFHRARGMGDLVYLLLTSFFVTFAFSNMEQTLSLLIQLKFSFETGEAGYRTGMILMVAGLLGAIIQGGLIKQLVGRFGEKSILLSGLIFFAAGMFLLPYGTSYSLYFLLMVPLTIGSSLINPTLSSLISKSADATEQGAILGLSQGLSSLARAFGPMFGLTTFAILPSIPYWVGGTISLGLFFMFFALTRPTSA